MLYEQYMAKKELLDKQNPPGTKNERELWHETKPNEVNGINSFGFNRSNCGSNRKNHSNESNIVYLYILLSFIFFISIPFFTYPIPEMDKKNNSPIYVLIYLSLYLLSFNLSFFL